jgi:uncharacterized protein YyaL (SSP411 family)
VLRIAESHAASTSDGATERRTPSVQDLRMAISLAPRAAWSSLPASIAIVAFATVLGVAQSPATAPHSGAQQAPPLTTAPSATPRAPTPPPKTGEKPPAAKAKANRLARETSPYLLLHAHNPVDWYPWGDEALAKAKRENKLIFLSIGYSSCYWCHVMERECFMDEAIAKQLNANFVCIKIDREERPDIDEVYMTSLQVLGRYGGWPLSMFLTPDAKPFFGGTYFPPRDREDGSPGFPTVIARVTEVWKSTPNDVKQVGDRVTEIVKDHFEREPPGGAAALASIKPSELRAAIFEKLDTRNGGFDTGRTKFPSPPAIDYLMRLAEAGDAEARAAALLALDRMAQGGLRDHLGGGFHRYTVDREWKIPHFEKMLYDNAQLASLYARGVALTKPSEPQHAEYRRVVDELVAFLLREMTDPAGGFYAALDAETDAVEGKFYLWTRDEIEAAVSKEEYARFATVYGIAGEPNFEEKFYVPQRAASMTDLATAQKTTPDKLAAELAPIRAKLLAVRNRRRRPLTDTKILAGWNGLMIRGLADAGRMLDRPDYTAAAARAADFVLTKMQRDGRLFRTHTAGQARLNAYLEDYALVVDGLLALHQATGDRRWLAAADALTAEQIKLFWDDKQGGFFFTSSDHEPLLAKRKDAHDGPLPSGNAVAASNLLALARLLSKPEYLDRAEKTLSNLAPRMLSSPPSAPRAAIAFAELAAARQAAPAKPK